MRKVAVALLALLQVIIGSCARSPKVSIVAASGRSRAEVVVEVADTPARREIGLMYRKSLADNAGMLFVFPKPAYVQFWMRNTSIPLDMIFADEDARVIGIVRNAEPYSETMLTPPGVCKYVLEVNAGFSAKVGLRTGDRLEFRGFTPSAKN